GEKGYDDNLLAALFFSRRYEEVMAAATSAEPSDMRSGCLVAARAAVAGTAAGIREASAIADPEKRREALETAAGLLIHLRLYPQAAELLSRAVPGAKGAAELRSQVEGLKRCRKHEDLSLPAGDPIAVVKEFLIQVCTGHEGRA